MPFIIQDQSSAALDTIQNISSSVSTVVSSWGSTAICVLVNPSLTVTLPVINTNDIGKEITIQNAGTNSFTLALTGGTITSAIGLTVKAGQTVTIKATSLTQALISSTNAAGSDITAEYVEIISNVAVATNLTDLDHVKFNTVLRQLGNSITLDTSSAYTSNTNVNSLGRITLSPNKTYELEGNIGDYSASVGGFVNYRWFNSDTGLEITAGTGGGSILGANLSNTNTANTSAITTFSPTVPTRVELRLQTVSLLNGYSGQFAANRANARIKVISGFAAVSGTIVDTISVNLTGSNLSIPAVNTDVIFNTLAFGNIPYNATTGVFTLTANKTYELECTLKSRGTTAGFVQYEWVDGLTGVPIPGSTNGLDMQVSSLLVEGSSSRAYLLYTPVTNQTVKIRVTGISGTGLLLDAQRCNANIKQIGSSAITTITRAQVVANTLSGASSASPGTAITFGVKILDTTNSFNQSTGVFIAPRTGQYKISLMVFANMIGGAGTRAGVILSTNGLSYGSGSPIITGFLPILNASNFPFGGSYLKTLNAGDSLTFRAFTDTASWSCIPNAIFDYVTIEEINPTF